MKIVLLLWLVGLPTKTNVEKKFHAMVAKWKSFMYTILEN